MIFIDSSFFIAAQMEGDKHRAAALRLYRELEDRRFVTTNHIVGETWTWLRRRTWHGRAVEFIDGLAQPGHVGVDFVPEALERDAFDWLRLNDEREYSFVDATSFAYMRSRGIEEALAFDGDFAAAGFTELRP